MRDRAGAVVFFGEDPSQYGPDPYLAYYAGLQLWDVIKQFPFDQTLVKIERGFAVAVRTKDRNNGLNFIQSIIAGR